MSRLPPQEPGPFGKAIALIGAVVLLGVAFAVSVVFLAIIAVVGLGVWGYFWWKTRELRKVLRERSHDDDGCVIEGEVIVVEEAVESHRADAAADDRR